MAIFRQKGKSLKILKKIDVFFHENCTYTMHLVKACDFNFTCFHLLILKENPILLRSTPKENNVD